MHFLVIGSGGREHAIIWKLANSPKVSKLSAIPGSDAIAQYATCHSLDVTNHELVVEFCKDNAVDLVVIGPEAPLVDGLVDSLQATGIACFGPDKYAAQLEGSKAFTKKICSDYNIPTAAYNVFDNLKDAASFIEGNQDYPIVLKADGLAAGKGVIIAEDKTHAIETIEYIFDGGFGSAGSKVVIEEFLEGEEASLFVITDGDAMVTLPAAQDHKRAFTGDKGPNTGGMGAYAPAPCMTSDLIDVALKKIVEPTLQALKDANHPYKGVLYTGLMLTKQGPKLIEYNARFGDPECQVLMMLLQEDLAEIFLDVANGTLKTQNLTQCDKSAICIVMATNGYPASYEKGSIIKNLPDDISSSDDIVFHAGTKKQDDMWAANGGRVLNVCAQAENFKLAHDSAYASVEKIDWPEGFFRTDIGKSAL